MMRSRFAVVLAAFSLVAVPVLALAHPGGVDATGGHRETATGTYHFHKGPLAGQSFPTKEAAQEALRRFLENQQQKIEPAAPMPKERQPEVVKPAAEDRIEALEKENVDLKIRLERLEAQVARLELEVRGDDGKDKGRK